MLTVAASLLGLWPDEKKSVTLSKKVRPCSWLKMG